jgi:hypothetical protein
MLEHFPKFYGILLHIMILSRAIEQLGLFGVGSASLAIDCYFCCHNVLPIKTNKKVVFASSRIQRLEHLVTPCLAVLIPSLTSFSPHL